MASENWGLQELVLAGWSQSDLDWEQASEALARKIADKEADAAATAARQALAIAREAFSPGDPRLASALANQAMCVARTDRTSGEKLLREARTAWNATSPWIEQMQAPRVARSSMFHMRMEQIHRDTYRDNWRTKWLELAQQAKARLAGARLDEDWNTGAAKAAGEQWQRERPAMLNDTRKLLGAVILLLPGLAGE